MGNLKCKFQVTQCPMPSYKSQQIQNDRCWTDVQLEFLLYLNLMVR